MSDPESPFQITEGRLEGSMGSWSLRSISGVHKVEGGKLSLKKYALFIAGMAAATSAITMGTAAVVILCGTSLGYMWHRAMKVMIIVDGKEIELLSIVYFEGMWNEEKANSQCDELIEMIAPHIK